METAISTNWRVSSYKTKQPLPPVPSKASDSKGTIPGRPPRTAAVSNNVIANLQAIKSAFQNFRKIDVEFMNFLESEQTAKTSTQSSMGCLHRESFCQSFPNGRLITYQSPNPSDNCQRLTQFQKQAKNPSSISSHSSSLERNEPEVQFLPTSYFHDAKNACKQDGNVHWWSHQRPQSERQFNDAIKFSCSKSKLKCSSCDAKSNYASHPKSNRLKSWILQLSQWVLKECVPVSRPKEFVRASATQESEQWSRFSRL